MLDLLKSILGIADNSQDTLLNMYVTNAQNYFLTETNLNAMPLDAEYIVIDIAVLFWNKRGSEGVSNESHSGNSYTWDKGFPIHIQKAIAKYRRMSW